jgi:FAD/FMN-containing dehydrogenase
MAALQLTALDGNSRSVADGPFNAFAGALDGSVQRPGDDGYDEAIAIWNGMAAKRPALVVRAASTEDVVRTIAFARDHEAELSIKGGGHNIAGLALSDGGITLDLSGLRRVEVDPDARLARVGGGCLLGDVDRATQAHGLATPLGFVSLTGVGGLTVGGGFGYLTRQFGWIVDQLEAVEIVTADGTVRRASRNEEAELFWAVRGGGGNFGVVTEFTFRLHPIGPQITGGIIAWPAAQAEAVLDTFRRSTESAPRELTLVSLRRNAPPAPWLPPEAHGTPIVAVLACHTGSAGQAERDLAPLRAIAGAWADTIGPKEYVAQQSMLDATQPRGMHYYWKSEWVAALTDGLLEAYSAPFEGLAAPANQAVLFHVAGALNEHPEDDGAVGNRDAAFACVVQAMSPADPQVAAANRDWVRSAWEGLRPFSTGGNYVNFQTADEAEERTRGSYRSNFDRLAAIKARYDPSNVFRVNRNVAPDRAAAASGKPA